MPIKYHYNRGNRLIKIVSCERFETLKFLFQLKSVPTKFNEIQFKKLNYVEIDCNNSVKNLKNISGFKNVKFFRISNFKGKNLPNTLREFDTIYNLTIENSKFLKNVNILNEIKIHHLSLIKCQSVNKLPNLENSSIGILWLFDLSKKFEIENLNSLLDLEVLYTYNVNFPSITGKLTNSLKNVTISNNIELITLENLSFCKNLDRIEIKSCPKFKSFDITLEQREMDQIVLSENENLENLTNVFKAKRIRNLKLRDLPSLNSIVLSDSQIDRLEIVNTGLIKIENVERIEKINNLYIYENENLQIDGVDIKRNGWIIRQNSN